MNKTRRNPVNIAAMTFAIGADAGAHVQLLPAGEFKATDGRPMPWGSWKLTAKNAPSVIALVNDRKNDFVIDYEHQTQLSETNGQPAPAAGWFKKVEFDADKGLFATDARWTARATQYIGADEYLDMDLLIVGCTYQLTEQGKNIELVFARPEAFQLVEGIGRSRLNAKLLDKTKKESKKKDDGFTPSWERTPPNPRDTRGTR